MKEIWVDCRKEDLEDDVIKYNATGILGQSKGNLPTLPKGYKEVKISSQEDIEAVGRKLKGVNYLIANFTDWEAIPTENLIALTQKSNTKVLVKTNDIEGSKALANALEMGVDGFVVSDPEKIEDFCSYYQSPPKLNLVNAEVVETKRADIGKRVCVDTIASFEKREGLLVGFKTDFMFLPDAETDENPFVNKRDWRVNAGAARMYTQVFSGNGFSPKYLDDLKSMDQICEDVLAVNYEGKTRKAYAAVLKKEMRPMIFIKAQYGDKTGTICSQNAETVRIVSPDGSIPVTKIKPGDSVKAYVSEPVATHFGQAIKERIIEI
ncbi:MAG: 3-dehydroquinate synthase II [Candidatus Aenigmatarchaeota archaeon]